MSVTFNIVRSRPKIVLQLGAILLLPWIWAAFVMPLWASGVCAALWVVAFRFAVHLFVVPRFKRRRASDSSLTPEQIIDMRAPTTGMFSGSSDEMLKHQTKIREQSVLIDELLDELRSMATRIGRLALDSSMVAGESGKHRDHLIELSDSIRETSNKTFDLTRTVRKSLETIRDELVVTYKVINKTAVIAKESAQRAKADVAQLNITMIAKTRE